MIAVVEAEAVVAAGGAALCHCHEGWRAIRDCGDLTGVRRRLLLF
jgi:hypothetical protein